MPDVVPTPQVEKLARQTWLSHVGDQAAFNRDLAKILADAAKEGERIIINTIGDGVGAEIRRAQYKIAVAQLQQLSTQMWAGQIDPLITSHIALSTDRAVDGLMAIDKVLAASLANPVLRESFLAAARNGADNVRSRLLNNIRLAPSVYGTQTMADTWVALEVNRGIALNKSAKEIARSVRSFIRPDVRGGVSYAAQRLGRTELNNAFHTTTIRAAADQPWITGFKWNTSGSHPKPDECDSFASDDHDGLGPGIFSKGNAPGKPHPQCLCYITTISVPDEEFHNSLLVGKYDKFLDRNGMIPPDVFPRTPVRHIGAQDAYNSVDGSEAERAKAMFETIGYDGLPTVGTMADVERAVFDGPAGTIHRAFGDKRHADQFKYGEMFVSEGVLGSGVYAIEGTVAEFEAYLSRALPNAARASNANLTMALQPDSIILDVDRKTLERLGAKNGLTGPIAEDPLASAAALGYDAVRYRRARETFMLILNRTKVIVAK